MIFNYWPRLALLALASFFLLHLLLAFSVRLAARLAIRFAARLQPRTGARLLLAFRLLPPAISFIIVALICIPSYISFEPEAAGENIGRLCIGGALLALLILSGSAVAILRAAVQSFRHSHRWRMEAQPEPIAGTTALVIESNVPFLALAGILRPTLIASRGLLETLSSAELEAAVRHELAHQASHDNLKRLLMHCAPGLFPFYSGFAGLEQAWVKLAERAADDRAVSGSRQRGLHLAGALLRVAGAGSVLHSAPVTTLLPEGTDLRQRVDRLLDPAPVCGSFPRTPIALTALCMALVLLQPFTLRFAHELLECLVR